MVMFQFANCACERKECLFYYVVVWIPFYYPLKLGTLLFLLLDLHLFGILWDPLVNWGCEVELG